MKTRVRLGIALLLAVPIVSSQPAEAFTTVLYLSVDVSGSISNTGFTTQRDGWAAAIDNLATTGNYFSPTNQVYVALDYWATNTGNLDIPFTLLNSPSTAQTFANTIRNTTRPSFASLGGQLTGTNTAFNSANSRINNFITNNPGVTVDKSVIDISTDGYDNVTCSGSALCSTLQNTTASIVASGKEINAIVVDDPAGTGTQYTLAELTDYANNNFNPTLVFAAELNTTEAFENEARAKLRSELVPSPVPAAALLPLFSISGYVRRTRKRLAALRAN